MIPFYVAERVCTVKDLGGESQVQACEVDYDQLKVRVIHPELCRAAASKNGSLKNMMA